MLPQKEVQIIFTVGNTQCACGSDDAAVILVEYQLTAAEFWLTTAVSSVQIK